VGWGKHSGVSWARGGPIKKNEQFINYTNGIFQNMILYNLFISKKRFTPPPPTLKKDLINLSFDFNEHLQIKYVSFIKPICGFFGGKTPPPVTCLWG
jgi:hypothetical protein